MKQSFLRYFLATKNNPSYFCFKTFKGGKRTKNVSFSSLVHLYLEESGGHEKESGRIQRPEKWRNPDSKKIKLGGNKTTKKVP